MSAPQLPTQVSSDGREIWAWGAALGKHVHRQAKIQELQASIRELGACGSCYELFWLFDVKEGKQ